MSKTEAAEKYSEARWLALAYDPCMRVASEDGFQAGVLYQAAITREETIRELCELLRGDEAKIFAFSQYETHKCSANDAHITRQEWATWLESKLTHGH